MLDLALLRAAELALGRGAYGFEVLDQERMRENVTVGSYRTTGTISPSPGGYSYSGTTTPPAQLSKHATDIVVRLVRTRSSSDTNVYAAQLIYDQVRQKYGLAGTGPIATSPQPPVVPYQAPQITKVATPAEAITGGVSPPTWRPGYEWAYRWESPRGKGTFVWSVDRVENVGGADYYVVKSGQRREIYWRRSDFLLLMNKLDGAVESRQTPITAWTMWPLTPGRSWTMHYKEERPGDRQTEELTRACKVDAEEDVAVPAGTFRTVKITCTEAATGRVAQEVWYAPQVKHWVRQRTHYNYGVQERELLNYRVE